MLPYSQLRLQPRIDIAKDFPKSGLMTLHIETTDICNFKCVFCPESLPEYRNKPGGFNMMDLPTFTKIADQIEALGYKLKLINYYLLGEPFVNKQLCDFIRLITSRKLSERQTVVSNGSLIKPNRYREICESGLDYIRCSIYGLTAEQYKERTQSSITPDMVKANLAGLKAFREENGFTKPFLYAKYLSRSEEENQQFLTDFGPCCDEAVIEDYWLNFTGEDDRKFSGKDEAELLQTKFYSKKKEVCPYPFYNLIIHSDLKVGVCCVDWNKSIVVGDLHNETIQQVWEGAKLKEIQRLHVQRKRCEISACAKCIVLHTHPDNVDTLKEEQLRVQ